MKTKKYFSSCQLLKQIFILTIANVSGAKHITEITKDDSISQERESEQIRKNKYFRAGITKRAR